MKKEWKLKIAKVVMGVSALFLLSSGNKMVKAETVSTTAELIQEENLKAETVDDAEMTGKVGYFTVNIDGDKQTSMKIKVNYSSLDESKKQNVTLTSVVKDTKNNHNLKIKSGSVIVETKRGSTKNIEKAKDDGKGGYVTDYNSARELIYQTKNYVIFEVTFTYDKEPYTYAVGEQVKSAGTERFNTKAYNWQNTGESTLSRAVYHEAQTEEFTMQVNIANTGIYDSGSGTVEGEYTIHLKHPTLNVKFKGNGATSGSEGTQVYTYNESKDLWNVNGGTLNFARTDYVKVPGAEWNKEADGSGISYNQDTDYSATDLADFTDGKVWTSKTTTLYAQWKTRPSTYGIYLHPNSPTGSVASWWRSGNWCHDNINWSGGKSENGAAYYNLSNENFMYKKYSVEKEYSLPAAAGNLSVSGYICANAGWYTSPDGGDCIVNGANGKVSGTALADYVGSDGAVHLYAHWQPGNAGYTVKHWKQKVSGTAGTHDANNYDLAETETFSGQIGSTVTPSVKSYTGFQSPAVQNGTVAADGSLVISYYYDRKFYNVTLHAGTGVESVSGEGTYLYGSAVNINAVLKQGYHWGNWTGTFSWGDKNAIFSMPGKDVDLTANAEANTYTIHFDPNGGMGHIDDIITTYDTDITLPDGAAAYKKYTLDGVNVTADVESGAISENMIFSGRKEGYPEAERLFLESAELTLDVETDAETPETDAETPESVEETTKETEVPQTEELQILESMETTETAENGQNNKVDEAMPEEEITAEEELKQAEGVADKTVYPSVFLGWALYDHKDDLKPQWEAGETVSNLTAEENGEITLYAVWDDCPWMEAHDLYYSLEQAQSGFITEEEILSHARATDREDGSPILPGVNPAANKPEVNTSFTIPDFQETEFTGMTHDAAVTENLTVVDSSGSTYRKQITVYVVDTTPKEVKPKGQTRFINEYYYNQPYEKGGLEDNSIWKTNPEYRAALEEAFENLKNDTPEETYYFTHETILQMKEYLKEHGIESSQKPDALQKFYEKFLEPNRLTG